MEFLSAQLTSMDLDEVKSPEKDVAVPRMEYEDLFPREYVNMDAPDRKRHIDSVVNAFIDQPPNENYVVVAKAIMEEVEVYVDAICLDVSTYPDDIVPFVVQFGAQIEVLAQYLWSPEVNCVEILNGWVVLSAVIDTILEHLAFESMCNSMDEIICDDEGDDCEL